MTSVSTIPKLLPIRWVFITYSLSLINLQSAYTSNLIRIFTDPPLERGIESLTDLAESDLPIFASRGLQYIFRRDAPHEKELADALYNKTIFFDPAAYRINHIIESRNCAVMIPENKFLPYIKKIHLVKQVAAGGFCDDVLHRYGISKGHCFSDTSVFLFSIFKESGIYDHLIAKHKLEFREIYNDIITTVDNGPVVLTVAHVYVVFILWIVGLAASILVFIMEKIHYALRNMILGVCRLKRLELVYEMTCWIFEIQESVTVGELRKSVRNNWKVEADEKALNKSVAELSSILEAFSGDVSEGNFASVSSLWAHAESR
ncbi:hypothetical protein FQA39_LY07964 [Lamprigera yunnana]|nr:hypothetical protein FQA39_LY07964 [Lamprigera yunnana]